MLTSQDFNSDIAKLDKVCEDCKDLNIKALLKTNILISKLLQNIWINQQIDMKSRGVKFKGERETS